LVFLLFLLINVHKWLYICLVIITLFIKIFYCELFKRWIWFSFVISRRPHWRSLRFSSRWKMNLYLSLTCLIFVFTILNIFTEFIHIFLMIIWFWLLFIWLKFLFIHLLLFLLFFFLHLSHEGRGFLENWEDTIVFKISFHFQYLLFELVKAF